MPGRDTLGHNLWWSFTHQRTHFVSISTETDFAGAPTTPSTRFGGGRGGGFGDQLHWLEGDLAAAQADPAVDWIVALGHRPLYESLEAAVDWPVDTELHVRKAFEPLFSKYGVDLYVAGHKHYYERLAPIAEGGQACDEHRRRGAGGGGGGDKHCTHYVIHGSAGNNEALTKQGTAHQNLVRGADYVHTGFLELEVANASHSFVRFIRSRRPSRFGPENSSCFQQLFLGPPKYLLLSLRGIPMENWLSGHTCERVRIASAGSHDGLVGDEGVLVKPA
jgi:hypothetical protein